MTEEKESVRRRRKKRQAEVEEAVEGVFGEEAVEQKRQRDKSARQPGGTKKDEPKQYMGKHGPRKTPPRRKVKLTPTWTARLDEMEAQGMTMKEFVTTLTPEELARGQLRNVDGQFVGHPPNWVPAEFHKECIRELLRRGKTMYQEAYLEAIQTMLTVANNRAVEPAQRIKAAQFVIERIEGKVPERLEVGVSEPWQEILAGIVADVPQGTPMRSFAEADEMDDEG